MTRVKMKGSRSGYHEKGSSWPASRVAGLERCKTASSWRSLVFLGPVYLGGQCLWNHSNKSRYLGDLVLG